MQLRRKGAVRLFLLIRDPIQSFLNPVITQKYTMRRMMENTARVESIDHMISNTMGMATMDSGALIKFAKTKDETTLESEIIRCVV